MLRRSFAVAGLLGCTSLSFAMAGAATAAPPGAQDQGAFLCSNGQIIDITTPANSGAPVAWVDGRGIAARAFVFVSSYTVTVLDGPFAGDVLHLDDQSPAARNGSPHPVNPDSLSNTVTCSQPFYEDNTDVVTADAAAEEGIPDKYIGATVHAVGSGSLTVYLSAGQLAHR